jgi:hypothetical protein
MSTYTYASGAITRYWHFILGAIQRTLTDTRAANRAVMLREYQQRQPALACLVTQSVDAVRHVWLQSEPGCNLHVL